MDNFVYGKRDLIVAGVALGIIVTMLGLGFGLTKAATISKNLNWASNIFSLDH